MKKDLKAGGNIFIKRNNRQMDSEFKKTMKLSRSDSNDSFSDNNSSECDMDYTMPNINNISNTLVPRLNLLRVSDSRYSQRY